MILQCIVLALIILMALYYYGKGALSASCQLAAVALASVLAVGVYEPVAGLVRMIGPADYCAGIAFLAVFMLGMSGLRFAFDRLVRKNIVLQIKIADQVAGAGIGLLAGMIVMGTVVLGLGLLPFGTTILGYNRYPAGPEQPAEGLWIPADGFVLGMYAKVSGGTLGGSDFTAHYPDFRLATWGQRQRLGTGSRLTLPAELWSITSATILTEKQVKELGITAPSSNKILMLRTQVNKGDTNPSLAADSDQEVVPYFRITPTQVRLVAGVPEAIPQQYFPLGYLDTGTAFTTTPWDRGYSVDDFNNRGQVITDWVFAIPTDAQPQWLQLKQSDVKPVTLNAAKDALYKPLARAEYAPRKYRKDPGTVALIVSLPPALVTDKPTYKLWLMSRSAVAKQDVSSLVDNAYARLLERKPELARNRYVKLKNASGTETLGLNDTMTLLLQGQLTDKPDTDMIALPRFMQERVAPEVLEKIVGARVVALSPEGKLAAIPYTAGELMYVITAQTANTYYVWVGTEMIKPATATVKTLTLDQAILKLEVPK
jgi:hypothetical protein